MTDNIFVKPAAGCTVLLPDGKIVPESGQSVENSRFIRRRIASGDLIECTMDNATLSTDPLQPVSPDSVEADEPGRKGRFKERT